MKIVYLIDQTYLHGGIEKILSQKANHLAELSGFEVYVVSTEQRGNKPCYGFSPKVKQIDLNINYTRSKSYFHPQNFKWILLNYVRLKKLLQKLSPDVVISKSFSPDQYFLPFLKVRTIIKEIHFSGLAIEEGLNRIDHFLFHRLISRYDALVLLNNDEKKYYRFGNVKVIPNFVSAQKQEKKQFKENIIIAAGRLAPVKQFDHLIKAWSLISEELPGWRVHIYGEGSPQIKAELQHLINTNKLTENVKLLGGTQNLNEKLEQAKIYAMTSATECFPMVLLEAMSAGCVSISYDCPHGPANIITHDTDGVLVENQNIEEFAYILKEVIQNEEKTITFAENARINSLNFSEHKIMDRWIKLFKT